MSQHARCEAIKAAARTAIDEWGQTQTTRYSGLPGGALTPPGHVLQRTYDLTREVLQKMTAPTPVGRVCHLDHQRWLGDELHSARARIRVVLRHGYLPGELSTWGALRQALRRFTSAVPNGHPRQKELDACSNRLQVELRRLLSQYGECRSWASPHVQILLRKFAGNLRKAEASLYLAHLPVPEAT